MGLQVDDPPSTPKLSLSKLPFCKPREPPPCHLLTPPLRPPVSIPFHWEEAPGKPRAETETETETETPPSRCLDLPPRLLTDEAKFTVMPSPTTVLDGPYVGRSLSLACTFSFRKGEGVVKKRNLGSGRWGSFQEGRGNLEIPRSLGDIFEIEDKVKVRRVRRRRSFFGLSAMKTKYLLADIYASFKQAVPWRRGR